MRGLVPARSHPPGTMLWTRVCLNLSLCPLSLQLLRSVLLGRDASLYNPSIPFPWKWFSFFICILRIPWKLSMSTVCVFITGFNCGRMWRGPMGRESGAGTCGSRILKDSVVSDSRTFCCALQNWNWGSRGKLNISNMPMHLGKAYRSASIWLKNFTDSGTKPRIHGNHSLLFFMEREVEPRLVSSHVVIWIHIHGKCKLHSEFQILSKKTNVRFLINNYLLLNNC